MIKNIWQKICCFTAFGLLFFVFFKSNFNNLQMMPGDLGDARLNNYTLEAIYKRFSAQNILSLYNLPFYAPFPYTLGLTENLIGSSFIYAFLRKIGFDIETSYQFWFLTSFFVNYAACVFALRKLNLGWLETTLGAIVFTFALPVFARSGHTQFAYRFFVPLSFVYFTVLLQNKKQQDFFKFLFFISWGLWCSIYLFFFTIFSCFFIAIILFGKKFLKNKHEKEKPKNKSVHCYFSCVFVLLLFCILNFLILYPYYKCSSMYNIARESSEILNYLPTLRSLLYTNISFSSILFSKTIIPNPYIHEQQMFLGVATLLFIFPCLFIKKIFKDETLLAFAGATFLVLMLILRLNDFSFWIYFTHLPLFSGIRVPARFDVVLLFPLAYIFSFSFGCLKKTSKLIFFGLFFCLFIIEILSIKIHKSPKKEWQERILVKISKLPKNLKEDSTFVFANQPPFLDDEIDSMFISLLLKGKTLNGYSGSILPGMNADFRSHNINEITRRLFLANKFFETYKLKKEFGTMLKSLVLVGFDMSSEDFLKYINLLKPGNVSYEVNTYHEDICKNLQCIILGKDDFTSSNWTFVFLNIKNLNSFNIASASSNQTQIKIVWKIDSHLNKDEINWGSERWTLPFDLKSNDDNVVVLPIEKSKAENKNNILFITLVQETKYWFHDYGFKPAFEKLNRIPIYGQK